MTAAPQQPSELAAFLEREFERREWSQRRAATELGIDKSTLGKIMNNPEQIPDLRTLRKLAEGLGVGLGKLIALCGFALGTTTLSDDALVGLTDEQINWWLSIPPSRRAGLLDALQRLYGDDEDRS